MSAAAILVAGIALLAAICCWAGLSGRNHPACRPEEDE